MLIKILGETLEFPNTAEAVPEIIKTTDQKLSQAGLYYSHFSIDGVKKYEELGEFLRGNIVGIEKVKVIGRTLKELTDEVILSAVEYLTGAIPAVAGLAHQFYQEQDNNPWQQLGELLEGIEWLLNSFSLMDRKIATSPRVENYPNWDEYLGNIFTLKVVVKKLGQAVESKDTVLVGDILSHEVAEVFKQMEKTLSSMLPWEE